MTTKPIIPLFDRNRGHPPVPTWRPPERGAQARSRMPPAAPAKPARSVLDGTERSAILAANGRDHRDLLGGVTAPLNCLTIGGESPP